MGPSKDLTGIKVDRLTPQYYVPKKGWLCKCDCGNEIYVDTYRLKNAITRHCGCKSSIRHKKKVRRLYNIWNSMKNRCENPYSNNYDRYGGRGIRICKSWEDYFNFENWALNHGYAEGLTLDRINVDGNYSPSNCRWADSTTQNNNKRNNINITVNGETHTLSEWCKIKDYSFAYWRYANGKDITELFI